MSNLIEVLPSTSSNPTPGWAYVPTTTTDYNATPTSMTGRKPAGTRKRPARDAAGGGGGRGDVSLRQHNATLRHLAELDRENHRDVHIPVLTKRKENAPAKGPRSKTTSNVRRILMSQKTFRNYLDDEEAAIAQGGGGVTAHRGSISRPVKPSPRGSGQSTPKSPVQTQTSTAVAETTTTRPAPAPTQQLISSEFDNHPLLRSYIPSAPSEKIMQQLLAEPPLSYNASRATIPSSSSNPGGSMHKPQRRFCGICGYWGRVKCTKCAARVCGLECYRVHEETRCDRFYA